MVSSRYYKLHSKYQSIAVYNTCILYLYLLYLYVWLCPIFNDYISISIHFVFHLQQITPKATSFGNLKSILENDSGLKLIVTEINKIPCTRVHFFPPTNWHCDSNPQREQVNNCTATGTNHLDRVLMSVRTRQSWHAPRRRGWSP